MSRQLMHALGAYHKTSWRPVFFGSTGLSKTGEVETEEQATRWEQWIESGNSYLFIGRDSVDEPWGDTLYLEDGNSHVPSCTELRATTFGDLLLELHGVDFFDEKRGQIHPAIKATSYARQQSNGWKRDLFEIIYRMSSYVDWVVESEALAIEVLIFRRKQTAMLGDVSIRIERESMGHKWPNAFTIKFSPNGPPGLYDEPEEIDLRRLYMILSPYLPFYEPQVRDVHPILRAARAIYDVRPPTTQLPGDDMKSDTTKPDTNKTVPASKAHYSAPVGNGHILLLVEHTAEGQLTAAASYCSPKEPLFDPHGVSEMGAKGRMVAAGRMACDRKAKGVYKTKVVLGGVSQQEIPLLLPYIRQAVCSLECAPSWAQKAIRREAALTYIGK